MPRGENLKPHHFKKGQSGNPKGRPKAPATRAEWIEELNKAIKTVEKKKKQKLLERAVEMSWKNPSLMIGLLKKIIPDQKYVEAAVSINHEDWVKALEAEEEEDDES